MLFKNFENDILNNLLSKETFHPFPKYQDRSSWEKHISNECKSFLLNEAEKYIDYQWPILPASRYLDFYRNGNRTKYENILVNKRRLPLLYLVIGECIEGKGRFWDDIINGVWTTLDEATWVIPAHNRQVKNKNTSNSPLPEVIHQDNFYVDLYAAETSAVLSWVYYLLGDSFPEYAYQVPERILYELDRRILTPYLNNQYNWMGFDNGFVNNWDPWITSNILTTMSFTCDDENKRKAIISKALQCLQFFINRYADDGGCDEGPGYWTAAGASLYDCLDIICDLTNNKVDLCNEELIKNICAYIYKMQITDEYYINYADASPKIRPDSTLIYRMGKHSGDENMIKMGTALYNKQIKDTPPYAMNGCDCLIYRYMKKLFTNMSLSKEKSTDFPLVKDVWFPGIEVMASRLKEGKTEGFFLTCKGGNNGESHNHNDVGSFIIYCDGKPAIVDIGTGVYEKKTFSDRRYEILQMQSQYHNLPIINGFGQKDGENFKSKNTAYNCTDEEVRFSLDISDAYPADAKIEYWNRNFTFNREKNIITLTDDFKLIETNRVKFIFMTPTKPILSENTLNICLDETTSVIMDFNNNLDYTVEIFDTSKDSNLHSNWGDKLYRNIFTVKNNQIKNHFKFLFSK